jgi:predicted metal-binding protein
MGLMGMRAECPRHIPTHPEFNPHIRQLLRVSFKLAAKAGNRYLDLPKANKEIVARHVTENIYSRHVKPLLVG